MCLWVIDATSGVELCACVRGCVDVDDWIMHTFATYLLFVKNLDKLAGELAARLGGGALNEDHDWVGLDDLCRISKA